MKRAGISTMLAGGDRRSIGRSEEVVVEVLANERLFGTLFDCMLADDPLLRMRAADAVEKITALRPDLLQPFKVRLMNQVAKIEQQEVRWHVAQLLPRLDFSRRERKNAVGILNRYLTDKSSIVRTCSMQALADLATQDAELKRGIIQQLKRLTEDGTPAMRSRGRKLLLTLTGGVGI